MAETKITFDSSTGHFPVGAYLRISGSPWWQQCWRIVSVDSPTTMTIRWQWWGEFWFQYTMLYLIMWANIEVWSGWNVY